MLLLFMLLKQSFYGVNIRFYLRNWSKMMIINNFVICRSYILVFHKDEAAVCPGSKKPTG